MIRVHVNSDTSIHGTYKSKDVTLKLLMSNKKSLGTLLSGKLDAFHEGDDGVFVFSFDTGKSPDITLRLDKDTSGECQVTLTKKMNISKEHLLEIESMLHQMANSCTIEESAPTGTLSSANLLEKNGSENSMYND
jgi:hypothetical protein